MGESLNSFDVFICYKKSSGKDFAEHLKAGLEELGIHSFIDSKDIPKRVKGKEEWISIRDKALEESKTFILIITPGFDLSPEVRRELSLARKLGNKDFIYFRHRDLGRKIIVDLDTEIVDLGRQQQVSFETKEELLRLAHNLLLKTQTSAPSTRQESVPAIAEKTAHVTSDSGIVMKNNAGLRCAMCSKPIEGEPHVEVFGDKTYNFDSRECARTFKKFKSLYGENFE